MNKLSPGRRRAVAKQQAEEGVEDAIHGNPVTDRFGDSVP